MVASKGTDPFTIPATADPNNSSDPYAGSFANLGNARFLFGFVSSVDPWWLLPGNLL